MAHFAKVLDGEVVNVIVAEQEFIDNYNDPTPGTWIQCSYNTRGGVYYTPNVAPPTPDPDQTKALRKNYPSAGYLYDAEEDAFYPRKPPACPSWVLNEQTYLWEPTVPKPADADTVKYHWDEENQTWHV